MESSIVVTVFSLEDGVVTDVVGAFPDKLNAMEWINDQIAGEQAVNPSYVRDDGEDIVMFALPGDVAEGFVYQIRDLKLPQTTLIDGGSDNVGTVG